MDQSSPDDVLDSMQMVIEQQQAEIDSYKQTLKEEYDKREALEAEIAELKHWQAEIKRYRKAEIDKLKKQVAELEEELEIQQSMGRY